MSTIDKEIEEVNSFLQIAMHQGVIDCLQTHLKALENLKKEQEPKVLVKETPVVEEVPLPKASFPPITTKTIKYESVNDFYWDQNEKQVKVYIPIDALESVENPADRIKINFTDSSFDCKIEDLNGKNYRLIQDNLEKEIDPTTSTFKVRKNKVIVFLSKKKGEFAYENWIQLIGKKNKDEKKKTSDDPMGGKNLIII